MCPTWHNFFFHYSEIMSFTLFCSSLLWMCSCNDIPRMHLVFVFLFCFFFCLNHKCKVTTINSSIQVDLTYKLTWRFLTQNFRLNLYLLYRCLSKKKTYSRLLFKRYETCKSFSLELIFIWIHKLLCYHEIVYINKIL